MDGGADGERKIDDVTDRGRAEETGSFLELLHVLCSTPNNPLENYAVYENPRLSKCLTLLWKYTLEVSG